MGKCRTLPKGEKTPPKVAGTLLSKRTAGEEGLSLLTTLSRKGRHAGAAPLDLQPAYGQVRPGAACSRRSVAVAVRGLKLEGGEDEWH